MSDTVVAGIRLGAVNAGIKASGKTDLVLIELPSDASVAGVFTQNAFCAAPVTLAKQHLVSTASRYFLINSGNANCGTGQAGFDAASQCCESLARIAGVNTEAVLPFSTGVIGEPLPSSKIIDALPNLIAGLEEDAWPLAAQGIMTTDTCEKIASVDVPLSNGSVRITGITKGAGMIKPNMATMLAYIATDATIESDLLQSLLRNANEQSFNRVTVDGDTSTNDACMLVATNRGPSIVKDSADYYAFRDALNTLSLNLAQKIIRDGEGATKFVEVNVGGGLSGVECLAVAYAVAESPLVKTALFASDPNWGRILAAVGRAGVTALDVNKVDIALNGVAIVSAGGRAQTYTEAAGLVVMSEKEIVIDIALGRGNVTETVWTTDFSYDYVKINAEYRS